MRQQHLFNGLLKLKIHTLKLPKFHLLRQLQAWEMGIDGKSLKPLTVVEHNSSLRFPYHPLFLSFTIAPSCF